MIDKDDLDVMDPQGVVDDPNHLKLSAQGQMIAKFMAAVLCRHFPDWNWAITVDERGGVAHVFCMELSGELGYTLLLDDLHNGGNVDWKLILVAGGEILERYGLPAGGKRPDWAGHCTWHNGLAIPDVTDKNRGILKHFKKRLGQQNGSTTGLGE